MPELGYASLRHFRALYGKSSHRGKRLQGRDNRRQIAVADRGARQVYVDAHVRPDFDLHDAAAELLDVLDRGAWSTVRGS